MEDLKSEIVGILWALLPGFVAAWIYYGLTAHRKQSQFERVVQAVIFTGLTLPIVLLIKVIANGISRYIDFHVWDANVQAAWGVIVGMGLGLLISYLVNTNKLHAWLLKKGITKRTAFPSEWFSAFELDQRRVLLHLDDGRRLCGWPYENPDHHDAGHFVLMEPEWILPNNKRIPISTTNRMLVPASKVVIVEFDKEPSEYTHDPAKHDEIVSELVKLNEEAAKEKQDAESADDRDKSTSIERATSKWPTEAPTDGQPA